MVVASYSNVFGRLVAVTRRLQQLVKGLPNIMLLVMRCNYCSWTATYESLTQIGYALRMFLHKRLRYLDLKVVLV